MDASTHWYGCGLSDKRHYECLKVRALELATFAAVFRDAFSYDPGHSDLDNEQPITIGLTLGDWRKLDFALNALLPQKDGA